MIRRQLNVRAGDRLTIEKKGKAISITSDDYQEKLTKLQQEIATHVKAKGLWGKSIEEIRAKAEAARKKEYEKKYGLRA